MNKIIKNLFYSKNDAFILTIIFINSIIIFLQECEINLPIVDIIDISCTIIFIVEMIIKLKEDGLKKYWQNEWNRMDGILVLISLPSLFIYFFKIEIINLSFLLILRLLRVFRLFRILHFFPHYREISRGFIRAIKQSLAVFIGFFMLVVISAMISCAIFKNISPEYFNTPTNAIYSIFRLFTIEGWYEIPESITEQLSPIWSSLTRIYFCILLILGGVIGISLVNSVFVDAMVSDNNDDIKDKLDKLEEKINKLL
ncbi:MAG: ion transporter [Paludibacteraceae bacterium]|nr:ion transporter [Paludibacteraceae bacterium]